MPRTYRQKRRAQQQEDTRRRIVEAAVELHGTVGPAETTISAIAERAGVQRLTVYKHFPEEPALFAACTAQWQAHHPPPDAGPWAEIADPEERLRTALSKIYTFYANTEPMLANTVRDLPRKRELGKALAPMFAYIDHVRAILATGWATEEDTPLLAAAIGTRSTSEPGARSFASRDSGPTRPLT